MRFAAGSIVLILSFAQNEGALFLSADLDTRYRTDFRTNEFMVKGLGVSARQVFSDRIGDRWILFFLLDWHNNFKEFMLDQAYLQYKGPLGKWQITTGRYLLPFGLLPNYTTKRLLINSLTDMTVGFDTDNGIMLSGILGNFDYALSASQGVGPHWKRKFGWLTTFRLGYQGVEFEELRIGVSGLFGKIIEEHDFIGKRLLAIDLIKYSGLGVFRSEVVVGTGLVPVRVDGQPQGLSLQNWYIGIFSVVDYAMFQRTDLNLGFNYLSKKEKEWVIMVGLSYSFAIFGEQTSIRVAQKFTLNGGENELTAQVYNYFSL